MCVCMRVFECVHVFACVHVCMYAYLYVCCALVQEEIDIGGLDVIGVCACACVCVCVGGRVCVSG